MLHLIFQSPVEAAVLGRLASSDVAVFLESSVFCVLKNGQLSALIAHKLITNPMYVLSEELAIRGIQESDLIQGLQVIDYPGLVNLSVENPLNTSWC